LNKITSQSACVIIEPVQAEGGIRIPVNGYLEALRSRCNETGTLLIFDEVQTGFGRTGSLFAFHKYGVKPDIILLAKALGGGYPLGAFVSSFEIMKSLSENPVLGHITTFGGHPVSCAAALASLQIIAEDGFSEKVNKKAALFAELFSGLPDNVEFRQSGLLMALDVGDAKCNFKAISRCIDKGIITDWFLFAPQAMRLAPPLNINNEDIKIACKIIKESLT